MKKTRKGIPGQGTSKDEIVVTMKHLSKHTLSMSCFAPVQWKNALWLGKSDTLGKGIPSSPQR